MKQLFNRSHGFTLVELMVVMTIMSILAAIVVPAVTGTTTSGRGTAMTSDISTLQNAVDRFVGDHPKGNAGGWPTFSGALPTGSNVLPLVWGAAFVDKDGQTIKPFAPVTIGTGFTTSATAITNGALLGNSYVRTALLHAGATKTSAGALTDASLPITIDADGTKPNVYVKLVTHTPTPSSGWVVGGTSSVYLPSGAVDADIPVWKLDSTGKVILSLSASEY